MPEDFVADAVMRARRDKCAVIIAPEDKHGKPKYVVIAVALPTGDANQELIDIVQSALGAVAPWRCRAAAA
mgnify:CR=1 FL=1